jgi:hypothetical protein
VQLLNSAGVTQHFHYIHHHYFLLLVMLATQITYQMYIGTSHIQSHSRKFSRLLYYVVFWLHASCIMYYFCCMPVVKCMTGSMKVMPPIFYIRKCNFTNNEIYMKDSYIFCNYEGIFPQSLHSFQHTFANTE